MHGGHVGDGDDPAKGFENWRKVFERETFPVQILIENTAGGENAMARRFDRLARLWEAVGEFGVGFCLDTCHAYSAGEELDGIVERVLAITGRIDLVHANSSRTRSIRAPTGMRTTTPARSTRRSSPTSAVPPAATSSSRPPAVRTAPAPTWSTSATRSAEHPARRPVDNEPARSWFC